MRFVWDHIRHWHLDVPTQLVTLLVLPLATYLIGIVRKHGKLWGGYLVEGLMYWLGRLFIHSIAARFSLRRHCRLQLQKENQYVYVPSRSEVKLEIDRVFVNLTLEQSNGPESYNQNTLLSAGTRIRVVGDPGSGKSSLIKRLFRDACLAAMAKPAKAKLPILVELKTLNVPRNTPDGKLGDWFYRLLQQEVKKSAVYKMEECYNNYAQMSGLLVLLDGLDEVASTEYERVQAAITRLSEHLSNLSDNSVIVLTMRTQLHQQIRGAFRESFGKAVFVRPFTPSDVYEFLSLWPFPERNLGPMIYAELTDRPTLREMCTNPLVLAMYVAERQSGSDPMTPESRTEFYGRVLEELLVKRRLRQTGPAPAVSKLREQRERILGRLAYDHLLDANQPPNSLQWEEAIKVVRTVTRCSAVEAAKTFLEIAKETGLVSEERTGESFRFIHLTFCEFLAAHEAVEGQKDGFDALLDAHDRLRNHPDPTGRSRLMEVIPFACGLAPRARRDEVVSRVAAIGDDALLARCFIETKTYEHPCWATFIKSTRDGLLNTPEPEWNEKWLQDLHLFNVVVRDARQCSAHVPNAANQIDLGEFYSTLVRKQDRSLSRLLGAYASQDAPAAFRLAELSGLDLPGHFPEVIIANCDQAPFLSLVIDKMLAEPARLGIWAAPLAEAGLSSRLVAKLLNELPPDQRVIAPALRSIPFGDRWDVKGITGVSLYTQVLSLARTSLRTAASADHFPQVLKLMAAAAPGSIGRTRRLFYSRPMATVMLACVLLLALLAATLRSLRWYVPHGTDYREALAETTTLLFTAAAYIALLRASATKFFYRILVNPQPRLPQLPSRAGGVFVFFPILVAQRLVLYFLTGKQRAALDLTSPHWERNWLNFLPEVPRSIRR